MHSTDVAHPTQTTPGIQGLGWFLRRTRDPFTLAEFYERALGLPRLRDWRLPESVGVMLWCGDCGVLELNAISDAIAFTPNQSPCTPVFRATDIDAARRRVLSAGGEESGSEENDRANIIFFKDPHGFMFAIEQLFSDLLVTDAEADAAGLQKLATLGSEMKIDGPIVYLSRILHECQNVELEFETLCGLGFEPLSPWQVRVGSATHIELRPSASKPGAPRTRDMAFDTWIARIYGFELARQRIPASQASLLSSHSFQGGTLDYAVTPNNILIGWQERKRFDETVPMTQLIEDVEARRQWEQQDGTTRAANEVR